MDEWSKLAINAGLPGVMLLAFFYAIKLVVGTAKEVAVEWLKIADRRVTVEERKTDAHVAALSALGAEVREHRLTDQTSHQGVVTELVSLREIVLERLDRTPVEGVPRISGEYNKGRGQTQR